MLLHYEDRLGTIIQLRSYARDQLTFRAFFDHVIIVKRPEDFYFFFGSNFKPHIYVLCA